MQLKYYQNIIKINYINYIFIRQVTETEFRMVEIPIFKKVLMMGTKRDLKMVLI